jgi:hypothetical protein
MTYDHLKRAGIETLEPRPMLRPLVIVIVTIANGIVQLINVLLAIVVYAWRIIKRYVEEIEVLLREYLRGMLETLKYLTKEFIQSCPIRRTLI